MSECLKVAVVPSIVRLARDEPGRAVVGEHDPVFLHRAKNDLNVGRECRDVEAGLQSEPFAHPRILRAGQ